MSDFLHEGNVLTKCLINTETVEVPEVIDGVKIEIIGVRCFEDCNKIKRIVLPNTIKAIFSLAFNYATSLVDIVIPESVEYIGKAIFNGCESLKYAIFWGKKPRRMFGEFDYVGSFDGVPYGFSALIFSPYYWDDVSVQETEQESYILFGNRDKKYESKFHEVKKSKEGLYYFINEDNHLVIGYGDEPYDFYMKDIIIPETIDGYPVYAIGNNAFAHTSFLSMILPECIEVIAIHAFACAKFNYLRLPRQLKSIDQIFISTDEGDHLTNFHLEGSFDNYSLIAVMPKHIDDYVFGWDKDEFDFSDEKLVCEKDSDEEFPDRWCKIVPGEVLYDKETYITYAVIENEITVLSSPKIKISELPSHIHDLPVRKIEEIVVYEESYDNLNLNDEIGELIAQAYYSITRHTNIIYTESQKEGLAKKRINYKRQIEDKLFEVMNSLNYEDVYMRIAYNLFEEPGLDYYFCEFIKLFDNSFDISEYNGLYLYHVVRDYPLIMEEFETAMKWMGIYHFIEKELLLHPYDVERVSLDIDSDLLKSCFDSINTISNKSDKYNQKYGYLLKYKINNLVNTKPLKNTMDKPAFIEDYTTYLGKYDFKDIAKYDTSINETYNSNFEEYEKTVSVDNSKNTVSVNGSKDIVSQKYESNNTSRYGHLKFFLVPVQNDVDLNNKVFKKIIEYEFPYVYSSWYSIESKAEEIIMEQKIKYCYTSNDSVGVSISGSHGERYTIVFTLDYKGNLDYCCTCPSYTKKQYSADGKTICKHIYAAILYIKMAYENGFFKGKKTTATNNSSTAETKPANQIKAPKQKINVLAIVSTAIAGYLCAAQFFLFIGWSLGEDPEIIPILWITFLGSFVSLVLSIKAMMNPGKPKISPLGLFLSIINIIAFLVFNSTRGK